MRQVICDKCNTIVKNDELTGCKRTGIIEITLIEERGDSSKIIQKYKAEVCENHTSSAVELIDNWLSS